MLYLANNTRPDIAFAVSQVARFSNNPKKSHATAIKTIVRYLKGTRNMGTIFAIEKTPTLKLYVDADFAGLHNREKHEDPDCARSRYGYVVTLGTMPITWQSKLISCICLSTLEAEYVGLSKALKTLLPIRDLVLELAQKIEGAEAPDFQIKAKVFEDNNGARILAQNHQVTSRTKYLAVQWHWFWSHSDKFELIQTPTSEQLADWMTKGLPKETFVKNRKAIMGW